MNNIVMDDEIVAASGNIVNAVRGATSNSNATRASSTIHNTHSNNNTNTNISSSNTNMIELLQSIASAEPSFDSLLTLSVQRGIASSILQNQKKQHTTRPQRKTTTMALSSSLTKLTTTNTTTASASASTPSNKSMTTATTTTNLDPDVALWYLVAAAKQLPILLNSSSSSSMVASSSSLYGNRSTNATTATKTMVMAGSIETKGEQIPMKLLNEIYETIGYCSSCCIPRSNISRSGILPVLALLLPKSNPDGTTITSTSSRNPTINGIVIQCPHLSTIHVEFIQACIYAEQYEYANRAVRFTWPCISNSNTNHSMRTITAMNETSIISIRHVLRYFYLRGIVHLETSTKSKRMMNVGKGDDDKDDDINWAIRCFEVCLVVRADSIPSAISVAAFKKLVLLQCRYYAMDEASLYHSRAPNEARGDNKEQNSKTMMFRGGRTIGGSGSSNEALKRLPQPLSLPKGISNAMQKLLSMASSAPSTISNTTADVVSNRKGGTTTTQKHHQHDGVIDDVESNNIMHVGDDSNDTHNKIAYGTAGESVSNEDYISDDPIHVDEVGAIGSQNEDDDGDENLVSDRRQEQKQKKRTVNPRQSVIESIKLYFELAHAFIQVDRVRFHALMTNVANHKLLLDDGNLRLVQQCYDTFLLHRHALLLSTVYSVISLHDLQYQLQLNTIDNVKVLLLNLSSMYQWNIAIDPKTDYVSFPRFMTTRTNTSTNTNNYSSDAAYTTSSSIAQELVQLTNLIHTKDKEIASSTKYSASMMRRATSTTTGGVGRKDHPGGNTRKSAGPRGVEEF